MTEAPDPNLYFFTPEELERLESTVGVPFSELVETDGRDKAYETYRTQLEELKSDSSETNNDQKAAEKESKKKSKKKSKQKAKDILVAAKNDADPVSAVSKDEELALRQQEAEARRAEAAADKDEAANKNYELEITLRKRLAWWSIIAASAMLGIGSIIFWRYMTLVSAVENQYPPAEAIIAWLSSSVLEVLGIVYLIASYLFPKPKGD